MKKYNHVFPKTKAEVYWDLNFGFKGNSLNLTVVFYIN